MKSNEILKHINNSINDAPINILDNIKNTQVIKMTKHDEITRQDISFSNINQNDNNNINENDINKPVKYNVFNNKKLLSLASLAAMFLIVFIGFWQLRMPYSQIYLDVNPSIQITTNRRDHVIDLIALNEDSADIVEDIDYKSKELNEVAEEIVTALALASLSSSTYIEEHEDVILLSVYNNDSIKRDIQVEELDKVIYNKFESYSLKPILLTQSINKSNTIEKYAKDYGISVGKMTFISNLIILNPNLNTEDLVHLSLYELIEISANFGIDIDQIINSHNDDRVHIPQTSQVQTETQTEAQAEAQTQAQTEAQTEVQTESQTETSPPTESSPTTTRPSETLDDRPPATTSTQNNIISLNEAKRIALSKTNGGEIVETDIDDDEFEFKIINNGMEYDVEIDLRGNITDFDSEPIDDYDD